LIVALHYEDGPIRELIHELKYGKITELAEILAPWLAATWERDGVACDSFVAIPLHGKRAAERGFNQAELLALGACRKLDLLYRSVLVRTRATESQTGLMRPARQANMYRAFRTKRAVVGLTCIVVDDVATTGATLEEAARALKDAGARRVWGLVVARG